MPISAGSVVDKISEVRSKIAVFEGLVLHLKSNYLTSSDSGEAEMKFYRGDYAPVPEAHVRASLVDLESLVMDLQTLLAQWEGIMIEVDEQTATIVPGGKKGKKAHSEARSERQDQPAVQRNHPSRDG